MRIALLALLAGCTTVSPIYAPDGKAAFLVECRGTISRCYQAAQEQCKGPYVPLAKDGTVLPIYTANQYGAIGGGARVFELTVRCQ